MTAADPLRTWRDAHPDESDYSVRQRAREALSLSRGTLSHDAKGAPSADEASDILYGIPMHRHVFVKLGFGALFDAVRSQALDHSAAHQVKRRPGGGGEGAE